MVLPREGNGMDFFLTYSRPNPFRRVRPNIQNRICIRLEGFSLIFKTVFEICSYPSLDIQHPIPYSYPDTQMLVFLRGSA
jgi:hypothetical protein